MGCCNKEINGEPISRARFVVGTAFVACAHMGILGLTAAASIFRPHYRRVLPFYVDYTRETLSGILRKERIMVGEAPLSEQTCSVDGSSEGRR